jgi:hypothetical protein
VYRLGDNLFRTNFQILRGILKLWVKALINGVEGTSNIWAHYLPNYTVAYSEENNLYWSIILSFLLSGTTFLLVRLPSEAHFPGLSSLSRREITVRLQNYYEDEFATADFATTCYLYWEQFLSNEQ